jgi:catechol 2,3-dioxygenase-like lactoylglutathione lyase family enzyme
MKLNQVTLAVSDIAESKQFYVGLGLKVIVDSPHYARFLCPDSDSTFSIEMSKRVQPGTTTVYFECDDLDGVVNQLKENGYAFDHETVDQRWLWREARLHDPDGYTICLYFAGENRVNPPWRVKDSDN